MTFVCKKKTMLFPWRENYQPVSHIEYAIVIPNFIYWTNNEDEAIITTKSLGSILGFLERLF